MVSAGIAEVRIYYYGLLFYLNYYDASVYASCPRGLICHNPTENHVEIMNFAANFHLGRHRFPYPLFNNLHIIYRGCSDRILVIAGHREKKACMWFTYYNLNRKSYKLQWHTSTCSRHFKYCIKAPYINEICR